MDFIKKFLPLPQVKLTETPRVPGIDGKRMSKSLKNTISLSDSPKTIEEKVKSMITDTQKIRLSDLGHPDICTVFTYQKIFNQNKYKDIFKGCKSGKLGCVECKKILAQVLINEFDDFRKKEDIMKIIQN